MLILAQMTVRSPPQLHPILNLSCSLMPSVGAVRMRAGAPSGSAVQRAMPPRRSWTPSGGRTADVQGLR